MRKKILKVFAGLLGAAIVFIAIILGIWEARNDLLADGATEAEIDPLLEYTRHLWDYYIAAGQDPSLAAGPQRAALEKERDGLVRLVG